MRFYRLFLPLLCLVVSPFCPGQSAAPTGLKIVNVYSNQTGAVVTPARPPSGDTATITLRDGCSAAAKPLSGSEPVAASLANIGIPFSPGVVLVAGSTVVCAVEVYTDAAGNHPTADSVSSQVTVQDYASSASAPCPGYSDCQWIYTAIGGAEQSDLSAQNTQTNGFADLFVRAPTTTKVYMWTQIRFLGAPNASNTSNIISAVSDPTGNITSSTLSTVGTAIDYVFGGEWDPDTWRIDGGKYSFGIVGGGGATTPLSSQTATVAYAVPAYGTNECAELHARLSNANGYHTALPPSAVINTSTTTSAGGSTASTSPEYCSVQPVPTSTVTTDPSTNVTTTTAVSGTEITNIAFAPQDRTNFLAKYYVGIRLIDRTLFDGTKHQCAKDVANPAGDNCSRAITDLLIGQDQSITGGDLHGLVFRTNITFPIRAGIYLYGSASVRTLRNADLDPLILTPTPITAASASPVAGSVTIPSPSVMVFPLRQSDRDFYRIGIALDLATVLPKLFSAGKGN